MEGDIALNSRLSQEQSPTAPQTKRFVLVQDGAPLTSLPRGEGELIRGHSEPRAERQLVLGQLRCGIAVSISQAKTLQVSLILNKNKIHTVQ